jgi:DNA protecting protein DprA
MPDYPIHCLEPSQPSSTGLSIWDISVPPRRIHVQGSPDSLSLLDELPERGFAVVGTREPQARSIDLVHREISELADSSLIIVSGLARGIDTAAHEAALHHDLPTIAILGAGLDVEYPRENSRLRQRILDSGGLLVSEFPPGTEPRPHHFLQRNRLIAGWAKATWVVEASNRSGALNTARWAREHHRASYATPCFPGDVALAGNQTLIDRDHAIPFWAAHSLGETWVELAARPKRGEVRTKVLPISPPLPTRAEPPLPVGRELELVRFVTEATFAQGGTHVQECLEWALGEGWLAEEVFTAVRAALRAERLQICSGLLTASDLSHKRPE